jgi:hypothetical protein
VLPRQGLPAGLDTARAPHTTWRLLRFPVAAATIREFLASSSARPSTLDPFSGPMIVEPHHARQTGGHPSQTGIDLARHVERLLTTKVTTISGDR